MEMTQILSFWTPGPVELIIILVIVILIFGRRLPEIAKNVGKSLFEFKKGMKESSKGSEETKQDNEEQKEQNQ